MKLAPLSWSLLSSATTVSTNAAAWTKGFPAANLWDIDFRKVALARGLFVVDATNNKIDFTRAGAKVATLASASYYSPTEFAIEVARAMTAADGAAWRCWWLQGSTNRHRFVLGPNSGTATLDIATGPNVTVNALQLLAGFRKQDRAAAATHTGDLACVHGTTPTGSPGDILDVDLGSAKAAHGSVIIYSRLSPGGLVGLSYSSSNPATGVGVTVDDSADSEIQAVFLSSAVAYRYWRLTLSDPRRTDAQLNGAGYWYLGPFFDTDNTTTSADAKDWEWSSYARGGALRLSSAEGLTGQPFISELLPGETFSIAFDSAPGLGNDQIAAMQDVCAQLGVNTYCIVALDTTNEPVRETTFCRGTALPTFERSPVQSKLGRWRLTLTFEKVVVL